MWNKIHIQWESWREIRLKARIGVPNKIKELRNAKGITQQQLADSVGVTTRTIISLEKSEYNPSVLLAFKISQFFEENIENVFLLNEDKLNS